ncbi:MAG: putative peptidoglycan glycosyltransferase FtsW [Pacificimonas sp.]
MTMFGRGDVTVFGRWYWTIDRTLLTMVLVLIGLGIIAVAAASPAGAARLSGGNYQLGDLFFLKRQIMWVLIGLPVLFGVSLLPKMWIRRMALVGTGVGILALMVLPFVADPINGSTRWIEYAGVRVQPSEFLKPMLVVTSAWILSLRFEDPEVPAISASALLLALVAALLVIQPDYGQTALIAVVWMTQAFIAGLSLAVVGALAVVFIAGLGIAYLTVPHITSRIDRFITGEGDNYQVERSLDALRSGGLFGTGPGEGQAKFSLPEPHTDYIYAVIGEEFGVIACLAVAVLFTAIVVRVLTQLFAEESPFVTIAAAGFACQLGLQAFINMGVSMNLLPAKGMTLPFVSHGGSSFIALALGMGMLLALTRRNRFLARGNLAAEPA